MQIDYTLSPAMPCHPYCSMWVAYVFIDRVVRDLVGVRWANIEMVSDGGGDDPGDGVESVLKRKMEWRVPDRMGWDFIVN